MLGAFDWWLYLSFSWQATKGYKHIQKTSCLAIPVNAKMLLSRQNRISNDHRATLHARLVICKSPSMAVQQAANAGQPTRLAYNSGLPAAGNPAHRGANMQPLPPLETQKGSQCNHVRRQKGLPNNAPRHRDFFLAHAPSP